MITKAANGSQRVLERGLRGLQLRQGDGPVVLPVARSLDVRIPVSGSSCLGQTANLIFQAFPGS